MGINWGVISGLITSIAPIMAPLTTGPVGAILRAAASSVVVVENFVTNRRGAEKKERAMTLVGGLLDVAEDAIARDLVDDPLVSEAVGAVIDLEVSLRNAHARLYAVVMDVQEKQRERVPVDGTIVSASNEPVG